MNSDGVYVLVNVYGIYKLFVSADVWIRDYVNDKQLYKNVN